MPTITYSFSDDTLDGFFRELWLPHKLKAVFFSPCYLDNNISLFSKGNTNASSWWVLFQPEHASFVMKYLSE